MFPLPPSRAAKAGPRFARRSAASSFRIAASAGSANGFMPSPPGYERVYVHLTGPFSYRQWFQDLKAEGVISKGMIPKLDNAFRALQKGVETVLIGDANEIKNMVLKTDFHGTTLCN